MESEFHGMIHIKVNPEMGRSIYANRIIFSNEVIETCEVLVLDPKDTVTVNDTELKWYTFKYDAVRDCLVLGNGEIFNHAESPNVKYELKDFNGRKVMEFTAIKTIFANDQLFINYQADEKVGIEGYVTNPSLVG